MAAVIVSSGRKLSSVHMLGGHFEAKTRVAGAFLPSHTR